MTRLVAAMGATTSVLLLAALRQPWLVPRGLPVVSGRRVAAASRSRRAGVCLSVGRPLCRALRLDADSIAATRLGGVVLCAVPLLVLTPPLAVGVVAAACVRTRLRALRARAHHRRQVLHALPDVVDHLLLCTGAGVSLPLAHPLVAASAPVALATVLRAADEATAAGMPRADALERSLTPLGSGASALAEVLAGHLRYGTPLTPALERVRLELRLDRRRAAEIEARRVPVRMLGPLVLCTLPAFVLLTVVPLLATSLRSLPT